jgi:F-type H+-transporting ATPase subunit b
MSAGMPQLDFSTYPSQIFWLFITLSVLYYTLARHLLPPVVEIVEQRKQRIAGDLERAKKMQQEAEQVKYEYELALQKARAEANQILQATTVRIKTMQDERVARLEESLGQQMQEAEARIRKSKDAISKEIQTIAENLAQDVVNKLVGQGNVKPIGKRA